MIEHFYCKCIVICDGAIEYETILRSLIKGLNKKIQERKKSIRNYTAKNDLIGFCAIT